MTRVRWIGSLGWVEAATSPDQISNLAAQLCGGTCMQRFAIVGHSLLWLYLEGVVKLLSTTLIIRRRGAMALLITTTMQSQPNEVQIISERFPWHKS